MNTGSIARMSADLIRDLRDAGMHREMAQFMSKYAKELEKNGFNREEAMQIILASNIAGAANSK